MQLDESVSIEELEAQIKEIEEAIHEIHLHKLISIDNYVKELEELQKRVETAKDAFELKKINMSKSVLKETRYIMKELADEEQRLRDLKAELFVKKRLHT